MQLKATIEYKVTATVEGGSIKLETSSSDSEHIVKRIVDLENEATRQSMIALGWKPPETVRERRFLHSSTNSKRVGDTILCTPPIKLSKSYDISADLVMFRMSQYDLYVTMDYSMMVAIAEFVLDKTQETKTLDTYICKYLYTSSTR